MSIELLYTRRCEGKDCWNWNGAALPYPPSKEDAAAEDQVMIRMGWSLRPDLCPQCTVKKEGNRD